MPAIAPIAPIAAIVDRNLYTVTVKLQGRLASHRELSATAYAVAAEIERCAHTVERHCPNAAPEFAVYANRLEGTVVLELTPHDSPVVATTLVQRALDNLGIATSSPSERARVDLAQARRALAGMAKRAS